MRDIESQPVSENQGTGRVVVFENPEGLPYSLRPMPIVVGGPQIGPPKIDIYPRVYSVDTTDYPETLSDVAIRAMRVRK